MVAGVFVRIHSPPPHPTPKKDSKTRSWRQPLCLEVSRKQLWEQEKGGRQQRKASEARTPEQVASEGCLGSV